MSLVSSSVVSATSTAVTVVEAIGTVYSEFGSGALGDFILILLGSIFAIFVIGYVLKILFHK